MECHIPVKDGAEIMAALGPVIGRTFRMVKHTELEAYDLAMHGCEQPSYLETL
ncbi:MAG: hypothetical protein R3A44_05250 [Caldilineaceae bacterium]